MSTILPRVLPVAALIMLHLRPTGLATLWLLQGSATNPNQSRGNMKNRLACSSSPAYLGCCRSRSAFARAARLGLLGRGGGSGALKSTMRCAAAFAASGALLVGMRCRETARLNSMRAQTRPMEA